MADWQTKKLGEICDFYNGLWKGKKPPYIEVGVIRNTNFTKDGELDDSDIAYLEVEKKQFENRKLTYGDIILEKSGGGPKQPVGRVVIFNKKEGDFSFSNFTSAIRVKKSSELDFNFLYRFLFFSYISGITEKMQSHSTGIRNLDSKLYKNIEIPFPPLPEQHRIVKLLDEVFEKTTKAKENAEKNLNNSKELFESYLQSVFANPGEDWDEKTLGDIGKPSMCKRILKHQTSSVGEIPFYKIGTFGKTPNAFISKEIYNEFRTKYSFPKKGDILISASGTIGRRVRYDGEPAFFQDSNIVWISNDEKQVLNDYLYVFYEFCDWQPSKGATIARLYNSNLTSIKIVFPKSIGVQKEIIKKLDELSGQTKKLEIIYKKKLADLEELKKSVLKRAFNGDL